MCDSTYKKKVMCDCKIPIKLNGKFYKIAIRPTMLYGTECWAVKM